MDRTVRWALALVAMPAVSVACSEDGVRKVQIAAHYVPACAPAEGEAPEQLELSALGDFDRSNDSVSILSTRAEGELVQLPAGTRAAELTTLGDRGYWGAGELRDDDLSILLWPRDRACELLRVTLDPATELDRMPLGGSLEAGGLLMLAGDAGGGFFDLRRGNVTMLDEGPSTPRRDATTSRVGNDLLVAGGTDWSTGEVLDSAERYDVRLGRFETPARSLSAPRARHGGLDLPSGATMLVGGEGAEGQALGSVEIVDDASRGGSTLLELLRTPRIEPQALLLDPRRILVGGGYQWRVDPGSGRRQRQPVGSVEFLNVDLAEVTHPPVALEPAALDRAFVALGAGSALAVGGCTEQPIAGVCEPCGSGGCVSRHVWWIDSLGAARPLAELDAELATPEPRLVAGARGQPWLLAGDRLGRFDPWQARFVRQELDAGTPPPAAAPVVALGRGLFAWLSATEQGVMASGLYHDQRSVFTQDVGPLLVESARGLLPHRPPDTSPAGSSVLSYAAGGGLRMSGSEAVASIAETRYADFTLVITLGGGPAPLIRLVGDDGGAGETFGGLSCPWPEFSPPAEDSPGDWVQLRIRRERSRAWLSLADAEDDGEGCERRLPERVAVHFVGPPTGTSQITRIEIRRSLD